MARSVSWAGRVVVVVAMIVTAVACTPNRRAPAPSPRTTPMTPAGPAGRSSSAIPEQSVPEQATALSLQPVAGPRGWQPVDFDEVRVYVPADWQVFSVGTGTGCENYVNKAVFTGHHEYPDTPATCAKTGPHAPDSLRIEPLRGDLIGDPMEPWITVRGIQLSRRVPVSGESPPRLVVELDQHEGPNLFMTFGADTPTAETVVRTLGPSNRALALQPGGYAAPPATWQPIQVGTVSLKVPPAWPVRSLPGTPVVRAFAYGGDPVVYVRNHQPDPGVGADGPANGSDGRLPDRTFVAVFDEPDDPMPPFGGDTADRLSLPGATAYVATDRTGADDGAGTDLIDVWIPSATTEVAIGLGNGWEVARTILGSIRTRP